MIIPGLLSKTTISQMQCTDSVFVRVLLHSVSNNGQARLRCRNRQYVFEKSHETGCHILDFPMSMWMHNVNPGRYRDQRSICDDFREIPGASFTIHVIGAPPAAEAAAALPADPALIVELRRLLTAMNAPEEVENAFEIAISDTGNLAGYVDGIIASLSEQPEKPAGEPEAPADDAPDFASSSPYTAEEAADLDKLHWKAFEKKYGMKKADFTAAKETALV